MKKVLSLIVALSLMLAMAVPAFAAEKLTADAATPGELPEPPIATATPAPVEPPVETATPGELPDPEPTPAPTAEPATPGQLPMTAEGNVIALQQALANGKSHMMNSVQYKELENTFIKNTQPSIFVTGASGVNVSGTADVLTSNCPDKLVVDAVEVSNGILKKISAHYENLDDSAVIQPEGGALVNMNIRSEGLTAGKVYRVKDGQGYDGCAEVKVWGDQAQITFWAPHFSDYEFYVVEGAKDNTPAPDSKPAAPAPAQGSILAATGSDMTAFVAVVIALSALIVCTGAVVIKKRGNNK